MIVVVKKDKGFLIATTPYIVKCYTKHKDLLEENYQLFKAKDNDAIICIDQNIRFTNVMRYNSVLNSLKSRSLTPKYMATKFFPDVHKLLLKNNVGDMSKKTSFPSSFIVAKNDRAYVVSQDGFFTEIAEEDVIGIGGEFVMGILDLNKDKDPLVRLAEMFYNVSKYVANHHEDMIVMDTYDKDFQIDYYSKDDVKSIIDGTYIKK